MSVALFIAFVLLIASCWPRVVPGGIERSPIESRTRRLAPLRNRVGEAPLDAFPRSDPAAWTFGVEAADVRTTRPTRAKRTAKDPRMKNILLLIHDDDGQEARLQAALDVTRALNGHLICLDITVVTPFVGEEVGISGGAMLLEMERSAEVLNRARLEPRIAREGMSFEWKDVTDYIEPALENAATLADLIVVNRAVDSLPMPDMRQVAASLIVESGKPVLAVPDDAKGLSVAGSVLVAWDGSREASDALAAAVPLLRLASAVTIVEIDDGSVRIPAEAAATYLSRHDIHPEIVRESGGDAARVLLMKVESGQFHYLVMGGFGHSRLAEALFGGVTRRLLDDCPIPILIAR